MTIHALKTISHLSQPLRNFSTWKQMCFGPISAFSVEDFGISTKTFVEENRAIFSHLPPDLYDVRRSRVEFLIKKFPYLNPSDSAWKDYFLGKTVEYELPGYKDLHFESDKRMFWDLAPFRKRAVSKFNLTFSKGKWEIKRMNMDLFSQEQVTESDFRKLPRSFMQLPESHGKTKTLQKSLLGIVSLIKEMRPGFVGSLHVVVHHVQVQSTNMQIRGNSPEGIHQDGFPYLVTALVVERENVWRGGESIIYDADKITPIFKTTLREGQGILQPDLGTKLWHEVTPIFPSLQGKRALRSIIGFDIDLLHDGSSPFRF